MSEKKSVATTPSFIPQEMKDAGLNVQGFEDMGMDTMSIPFIKVLNAMSPELDDQNSEFIDGAKQGDVINSVTKTKYGREFQFVVLKMEHLYVEWKQNRGGLVGYHNVAEANANAVEKTFGAWKTAEGNDLQETFMYYMIVLGHEDDGIVIFSADSSDLKNGKKLNTMLAHQRFADGSKAAPFLQVYTAKTVRRSNDNGSWYALDYFFERVFEEQDAKLYGTVEENRTLLKSIDMKALPSKDTKALPDVEY